MRSLALFVGATLAAVPLEAQQSTRLGAAEARYAHPLSSVRGIRELPDGRLLVADGIDETVLIVNLRTGKTDTLGRVGQGPGEYKSPDALYPLPDGGTLLVDLGNGRLSFFDGNLRYRESAPLAQGGPPNLLIMIPRAVDAQGRIYFQQTPRPGPGGPPDSAAAIRWDRATGRFDTVATVKLPDVKVETSGGANNRSVMMRPRPYPAQDAWAVAPDGRIAVARAGDYHAEWLRPGGSAVKGPANRWTPVPVRRADQEEFVAELSDGIGIRVESENGRTSMSFGRGGAREDDTDATIRGLEWPPVKPPFLAGAVWVTPEGEMWVERAVATGSPRVMDVFDANARLVRSVTLPAGRRMVGFGAGTVYLRQVDEDGLSWLERYRR